MNDPTTDIECPLCLAPIGERCTYSGTLRNGLHTGRIHSTTEYTPQSEQYWEEMKSRPGGGLKDFPMTIPEEDDE